MNVSPTDPLPQPQLSEDTPRPIPYLAMLYFFATGCIPMSLVAVEFLSIRAAVIVMGLLLLAGYVLLFPAVSWWVRFMVVVGLLVGLGFGSMF